MKIMGPGAGLFMCTGTGLGIGLFSGPGWGWKALTWAAIIAILNVVLKSDNYQDYIANCKGEEIKLDSHFLQRFIIRQKGRVKPNRILYLFFSLLQNVVVISIVAVIVLLVKGILKR